ncbi:unnamed protein product [Prorocentrum cordatum]|uniref:Adenylate kinase n=1 Tax=Prorocentrum cordatum TaxID=2364126 RepID=A0ABN9Y2K0_9DINO|nr:unnamed protein product [Polarella glacialis]
MAPKQQKGQAQRERAGAGALALAGSLWCAARAFVPTSPGAALQAARTTGASMLGQRPGASEGLARGSPIPAGQVGVAAVAACAIAIAAWPQASRRGGEGKSRVVLAARGGGVEAPLVVIAGPPAAGKGTQCEKIKAKYGYVHISTGDILRENVKNGTELGKKAEGFMKAGALVPSELIVDLDRLEKDDVKEKGCLLDGFPRAPDQAQAMVDAGLKVKKFLLIDVPDEELVVRGCGRRLDPETGEIYHLKFKPPPAEIMDRLVHRSDDQDHHEERKPFATG